MSSVQNENPVVHPIQLYHPRFIQPWLNIARYFERLARFLINQGIRLRKSRSYPRTYEFQRHPSLLVVVPLVELYNQFPLLRPLSPNRTHRFRDSLRSSHPIKFLVHCIDFFHREAKQIQRNMSSLIRTFRDGTMITIMIIMRMNG